MAVLVAPRMITLAAGQTFTSPKVALGPQTATLALRLRRPTTAVPLAWPANAKLTITLIIVIDGVEHRLVGSASGGVRKTADGIDAPYVTLSYQPLCGFLDGPVSKRLGETAKTECSGYVVLTASRAMTTELLLAETSEAPAPRYEQHSSVAFVSATSGSEEYGDGVVTVSNTSSTAADRAVFVGVTTKLGGLGAVTYNGSAMTEDWDVNGAVGGYTCSNAGYHLAGTAVATGARNVVSTIVGGYADSHVVGVINVDGVDTAAPIGTVPTPTSGTTSPATITVTGDVAGDLVVDSVFAYSDNNPAVEAAQTSRYAVHLSTIIHGCGSTQAGGTVGGVMSWGMTGSVYARRSGALIFKAPAAGGVASRFLALLGAGV